MPFSLDRRSVLVGLGGALASARSSARAAGPPIDLSVLERRQGGRIGFAMFDSADGRQVAWRGDERFAYCSTFKLFLAAATLQRVQRGTERLSRRIPMRKIDLLSNAPVTEKAVGRTIAIGEVARAAVEFSDNPAGNLLIRELGGLDAWRRWYRSIGDHVTRVDRLELGLNQVGPGDTRDTTSPLQAIANMRRIFEGDFLTPAHRALLTRWMVEGPTGERRIRAAAPAGATVAHKTGTAEPYGHTNDIGFISLPGRAPVYVAAYANHASLPRTEDREAVIADAVRAGLTTLWLA